MEKDTANWYFAPSDKIREDAYELVKRVFGLERVVLTNESTLDDFDGGEKPDDFPGHTLRRFPEITEQEKDVYQEQYARIFDRVVLDKWIVWSPPLSEEERNAQVYKR